MVALARSSRRAAAKRRGLRLRGRRARGACARRRNGCRRNISTTPPARCCSSASPSCRNIIRPAARCSILRDHARGYRQAHSAGLRAGRIRQRLEPQGAHAVARSAARLPPTCRSISAARWSSRRRPNCGRISPRLKVLPVTADITQAIRPAGRGEGGAGARRIFPRLDHRQFRAARGGGVPAQCRPHPRRRRDADHRRRPDQAGRDAQRRL